MSVAVRTITRIQDGDDAPSLGAGQDGYALTWDNATGAFVATALSAGVTDHGALTGLSDDDHSQYLLATGARTGASAQAQTFTNAIVVANGTLGAPGVVFAGNTKVGMYHTSNGIGFSVGSGGGTSITFDSANWSMAIPLRLANGSAAAPSYSFSGDSDTGMYRAINGNEMVLVTGGTARIWMGATGLVGIGTDAPATTLHAVTTDTGTSAVVNIATLGHNTSGTAAAGFGGGLAFNLQSSTTASQSAARIQSLWYEATHASRKADLVLTAYDTAEREGLRIRGAGSAAAIGFLGATPQAQIAHVADPSGGGTVDAEARTAINSILSTLELFGFHATS